MPSRTFRTLVIEPEVLIAMDIERILVDLMDIRGTVDISRCGIPGPHLGEYDLVIYSVDSTNIGQINLLRNFVRPDTAVVLLSTFDENVFGNPVSWPLLSKPFSPDELTAAVRSQLSAIQHETGCLH